MKYYVTHGEGMVVLAADSPLTATFNAIDYWFNKLGDVLQSEVSIDYRKKSALSITTQQSPNTPIAFYVDTRGNRKDDAEHIFNSFSIYKAYYDIKTKQS